jgi:acyl-CoA dehydrogenase
VLIFPTGKNLSPPSDKLGHQVAVLLQQPGAARDRLTAGMYLPGDEEDAVGALEAALLSTLQCEPALAKMDAAHKAGQITAMNELASIAEALQQGLINDDEARLLERDHALQRKVIMVDDFAPEQLAASSGTI